MSQARNLFVCVVVAAAIPGCGSRSAEAVRADATLHQGGQGISSQEELERSGDASELKRAERWIAELDSADDATRKKAKAKLRQALAKEPSGRVPDLLRHANVISENGEVRRTCRELLRAEQGLKRKQARKKAAGDLQIPLDRVIDIPHLPEVLNDIFFFAVFNPESRIAGPTAKAYVSVNMSQAKADPIVRSYTSGVSSEEFSRLLAASDFEVTTARQALEVAVLAAGLASTEHADGWCVIPQPDSVAPCDGWPEGKTLPRGLQQKAVKAQTVFTPSQDAYVVRMTTWTALGGRVTSWKITVTDNETVRFQDREVIGGAFGIGFS